MIDFSRALLRCLLLGWYPAQFLDKRLSVGISGGRESGSNLVTGLTQRVFGMG